MNDAGMSPMRVAAVQLHEMYGELKRAGFSRGEALELVARMVASSNITDADQGNEDSGDS